MAQGFHFLNDVALADSAFEAWGDSLSDVFMAATQAVIEIFVDPHSVCSQWTRVVTMEQTDAESLLFDWLSELVFIKDAEGVVFEEAQVRVTTTDDNQLYQLEGSLKGEPINPAQQDLGSDVKAVTKHQFSLKKKEGKWVARVVLDL
jgi:SHS2 domain-containing protein